MPRHPRVHAFDAVYHLIARGNNGQAIFLTERDYRAFLSLLKQTKTRYPFTLAAYALMPNHFHLLVEVKKATTSNIMQSLLTAYARYFNRKHNRRGHLYQGRYKAILCEKTTYLMELIRYIHLNPVRAQLASAPAQWPWSGHREYCGEESGLIDSSVVSEVFGRGSRGFERYSAFLADGVGQGYTEEFYPGDRSPFLGSESFQDTMEMKQQNEMGKTKKISLEEILSACLGETGLEAATVRQKAKFWPVTQARKAFIRKAILENGYRRAEVARYLNCGESYISKVVLLPA